MWVCQCVIKAKQFDTEQHEWPTQFQQIPELFRPTMKNTITQTIGMSYQQNIHVHFYE